MAKFIDSLFPQLALNRMKVEAVERYYAAAQETDYHRTPRGGNASADSVMDNAKGKLREIARVLDENHDLATGILNDLVTKSIGSGLQVEPMVKSSSGKLMERVNKEILRLWLDWSNRPEVTRELHWCDVQRLVFRTWLRDGEILTQLVNSDNRLRVPSEVKFSLELLEADYLPFDYIYQQDGRNIVHGVEKDAWGRPIAFHLLKEHPGNSLTSINSFKTTFETKRVRADDIIHTKYVKRIRQTRGVTIFHSILERLENLADYENSEQIAARIAASMAMAITRSDAFPMTGVGRDGSTKMDIKPGIVFDQLLPGEKIESIGTERPNTNMQSYRDSMMRAAAAGTGTNASSISKKYDGNYSSQRQELVESDPAYAGYRKTFIEHFLQPVYQRFVELAVMQGKLTIPRSTDMQSLYHPAWSQPAVAWIDPKKEMEAMQIAVNSRFTSRSAVIRKRGEDPDVVDNEIEQDDFQPVAPVQPDKQADENTDDENTDEVAA